MTAIDYSDPCAVLPIIREAYYKMLGGGRAQSVEFVTANGTKRVVTYQKSDINSLREEVRRLEGMCGTNGVPARRRAILAGGGGCC